jgi:hypothetical protein
MVVAFTTAMPVAATPPIVTAVAPVKFVPLMLTGVPPAVGPLVGEMPVTAGAATTITLPDKVKVELTVPPPQLLVLLEVIK